MLKIDINYVLIDVARSRHRLVFGAERPMCYTYNIRSAVIVQSDFFRNLDLQKTFPLPYSLAKAIFENSDYNIGEIPYDVKGPRDPLTIPDKFVVATIVDGYVRYVKDSSLKTVRIEEAMVSTQSDLLPAFDYPVMNMFPMPYDMAVAIDKNSDCKITQLLKDRNAVAVEQLSKEAYSNFFSVNLLDSYSLILTDD